MLNQTVNHLRLKQFIRMVRINGLTVSKRNKLVGKLVLKSSQITKREFDFKHLEAKMLKGKIIWKTNDHFEILILKYVNFILKKIYKVKQGNRNLITSQVHQLLKSGQEYTVIRTDIHSFYESLNFEEIYGSLEGDTILSNDIKYLILKILDKCKEKNSGIPRGICFSPTLAEYGLRKFDTIVKNHDEVFFYSRYVDDIIIFIKGQSDLSFNKIKSLLPKGLQLNEKKSQLFKIRCRCSESCICIGPCICLRRCKCKKEDSKSHKMNYLGYEFEFADIPSKPLKESAVKVRISTSKIKRLKSRIIYSLLDFTVTKNYALLKSRIQFLTSNYKVFENIEDVNLKAGIYYSYPIVNFLDTLDDLNVFLKKAVTAKNKNFGTKLKDLLTPAQKNEIMNFSFTIGYRERRLVNFTSEDIAQIKKCWSR